MYVPVVQLKVVFQLCTPVIAFSAGCVCYVHEMQDVIAHSGGKGRKGVDSTRAAAKQVLVSYIEW